MTATMRATEKTERRIPAPETLSLSAGLVIDPSTKAIAPNISMSVNNLLSPGDGAFSARLVLHLSAYL